MRLPILATLMASVVLVAPAGAASGKKHKATAHRTGSVAVQARPGSAADPYAVYVGGEYIGRDPDPNIRAFMMRNPHIWDGPD